MSKKIFLLSLLIGLMGGGLLLFAIGKSYWLLSWTIGVLLGIYPFIFWQITQTILNKVSKYSQKTQDDPSRRRGEVRGSPVRDEQPRRLPFRYYLLIVILAFKFIILSVIIICISNFNFIISTSFLIGFIIMAPIIVIMILMEQLTEYNDRKIVFKGRINLF